MITGQMWFTGKDCIGVVQVVQDHEEQAYRQTGNADFQYYVGLVGNTNYVTHSKNIADFGAPFPKAAGDVLFNVVPSKII